MVKTSECSRSCLGSSVCNSAFDDGAIVLSWAHPWIRFGFYLQWYNINAKFVLCAVFERCFINHKTISRQVFVSLVAELLFTWRLWLWLRGIVMVKTSESSWSCLGSSDCNLACEGGVFVLSWAHSWIRFECHLQWYMTNVKIVLCAIFEWCSINYKTTPRQLFAVFFLNFCTHGGDGLIRSWVKV